MSGGELTADQIRALLHELGRRLQARGVHRDVRLVGGAALILQGIGNRPTADIDASYADPAAVNSVVTEMAEDYDLAPDWLNSNATAFVPDNATWVNLEQLDGLTIQAADTETLLAMKIAAERDKDTLDIARLLRRLNITNADDAVDLAYNKYGDHSITLAAGRDNYLIVVEDALDAVDSLEFQSEPESDEWPNIGG
ncbi:DUF6036 family nucleotidyltransferase [Arthrobacter bambusae]|uniref:DUF6036 family nucleotidyltransferase n=1 Tax=Arthrobacter bambusae TaxID=1338426 RepID=UPI0027810560|nr:DUF6036 family nucleotidyltransferase [Arthrobacter bambusae]MDQ0239495.1 hypothetical protein [Arthrobacter bambusae]